MKKLVLAVLTLAGVTFSMASFAEKTNFLYTTLSIELGRGTLDEPICLGGQCLSSLGVVGIGGSYQFADDLLVISLTSVAVSGSTSAWEVTSGVGAFGLGIVKAISDKIDIGVKIASLSSRSKVCVPGICISDTDTGTGFSGGLQFWLDDIKKLAGNVSIASSKFSKSTDSTTSINLGLGYYVTEQSEIYGAYGNSKDASSFAIGYVHHF